MCSSMVMRQPPTSTSKAKPVDSSSFNIFQKERLTSFLQSSQSPDETEKSSPLHHRTNTYSVDTDSTCPLTLLIRKRNNLHTTTIQKLVAQYYTEITEKFLWSLRSQKEYGLNNEEK